MFSGSVSAKRLMSATSWRSYSICSTHSAVLPTPSSYSARSLRAMYSRLALRSGMYVALSFPPTVTKGSNTGASIGAASLDRGGASLRQLCGHGRSSRCQSPQTLHKRERPGSSACFVWPKMRAYSAPRSRMAMRNIGMVRPPSQRLRPRLRPNPRPACRPVMRATARHSPAPFSCRCARDTGPRHLRP